MTKFYKLNTPELLDIFISGFASERLQAKLEIENRLKLYDRIKEAGYDPDTIVDEYSATENYLNRVLEQC